MKFIRKALDNLRPLFEEKGKFHKLNTLYEAIDTFIFSPGTVTSGTCHIRDAMDLKRMMIIVVVALIPCIFMAIYNTGYQANKALMAIGIQEIGGWRAYVLSLLNLGYNPNNFWDCFIHGALYFIPVYLVCNIVGGFWEVLFAAIRKHEVNEGFLVTGILFPLTLPPTIPLWQVALGISFGVVFGKEVFGGTGRNILNPALTARVFLFFAYPSEISGDSVWIAVNGVSAATPLGILAVDGMNGVLNSTSLSDAFWGFIPGSMGETSKAACIFGAFILLITGVGSYKIILGMLFGMVSLTTLFYNIGSVSNASFSMPPHWHLVVGSFVFGLVFMATDPVSASMAEKGKFIYGLIIGALVALVRVVNPAFPEGTMLAILLGNVFAPLIDYFIVKKDIKRRRNLYNAKCS